AVMRSAISALAGLALAGSFAFAQPSDGRLKIIHETATIRVAHRIDSRPFSYVDAQGRPLGYTIELCERIARSLEAQLNVALTIKFVPVDERTRFDAIVNGTADNPTQMQSPARRALLQDVELMPQYQDFGFQRSRGLKKSRSMRANKRPIAIIR